MQFTVTITTCNRADSLARSLAALSEQDYPGQDFEVIVADNGSRDHTKATVDSFAERFTALRYIYDARPGQLVGWHRGLASAQGEITCFIDDDARPAPGWLAGLAECYRDPRVGLATGPIKLAYDARPPDWLTCMTLGPPGAQTLPFLGQLDCGDQVQEIPGNFVWGTNFSVRRQVLHEVGGFHPCAMPWRLIHFYGDGEIHVGRSASQRGHKVLYHPAAAVQHEIPVARLTFDGVKRKFTSSGCARAFQTLRQTGTVFDLPSRQEIRAMARRYFGAPDAAPGGLIAAVEEGLIDGLTRQRDAFVTDPHFRDWVLAETYLDLDRVYTHPDLRPATETDIGDDWRSGI